MVARPWLGGTIARAQVFNGIGGSAAEGGMLFGLSPKMSRRELFGREGFKSIYVNLMGIKSLRGLMQRLEEAWRGALEGIDASINLSLGPIHVDVRRRAARDSLLSFLLRIDEDTVIALDEVQELSPVAPQLLRVLGNVFASHPRIRFIFTGSYMGLMKMLIDADPDSPCMEDPQSKSN